MRVTGGTLCGRRLTAPKRDVRPTGDRVREALFAILGDRVFDSRFLDLYAGSGSVGLEAWSRGAREVCWVESDRRVMTVLKRNVREICECDRARVINADVHSFLKKELADAPFDIIFADPPYSRSPGSGIESRGRRGRLAQRIENETGKILAGVAAAGATAENGLVIIEQRSADEHVEPSGWQVLDRRVYGETGMVFFTKKGKS